MLSSEVTHINKQTFLTELGKYLTFMYEEDRQTALDLYSKMFDDAEDEVPLVQYLSSPTRQAVIVARSYNSRDHKLQVHAPTKGENAVAEEGTPEFVTAILGVREDAERRQLVHAAVSADQLSLFDPDEQEPEAPAESDGSTAAEEPSADVTAVSGTDAPESGAAGTAPETDVPSEGGDGEAPEADPAAGTGEAEPPEAPKTGAEAAAPNDFVIAVPEPQDDEAPSAETPSDAPVRKPKIALLILFALIAIPVGLICLAVLLIPTLLSLCISIAATGLGVLAVVVTLSGGFVVFADIMLVLGVALILFAFGLLFLWIFVWFIGGAMVGLVQWLLDLGGKWCFKEEVKAI